MTTLVENLVLWPIDRLVPYKQNAKVHPEEQVDKIAKNMAQFGFDVPIVVDENGVILKGHGRRLAALRLGLERVPVLVRTGLSENQKRSIRISDNTLSSLGIMDFEMLSLEVKQMMKEADEYVPDLDDLGLGGFNFDLGDDDEVEIATVKDSTYASEAPSAVSGEGAVRDYSRPDLSQEKVPVSLYQVVTTVECEDEQRQVYELLMSSGWENVRILTI